MKVITKENVDGVDTFFLTVIPRFYTTNIGNVSIREPFSNVTLNVSAGATIFSGLLYVDLGGFIPVNEAKYSIVIKDAYNDVIWSGQALYTEKDKENYSLNNSDENNLKF